MVRRSVVVVSAVVLVTIAGVSDGLTWWASRSDLPRDRRRPAAVPGEVVLVLGFPSRPDGSVSAMQRWRSRVAVRSTDPAAGRLLFSGGPTRGGRSEASVMAEYAIDVLGFPPDRVTREEASSTTWENVVLAAPLLHDSARVKVASNTFHARRARGYLRRIDPALARRLARATDHRFGELLWLKPILVGYEGVRLVRTRASARSHR